MAKVGDEGRSSIYFETDPGNSETYLESPTGEITKVWRMLSWLGRQVT